MSELVNEAINEELIRENERLRAQLDSARTSYAKYQNDVAQQQQASTYALNQIVAYAPQLTQIATNLSYVASSIQANNAVANRVADSLAKIAEALSQEES